MMDNLTALNKEIEVIGKEFAQRANEAIEQMRQSNPGQTGRLCVIIPTPHGYVPTELDITRIDLSDAMCRLITKGDTENDAVKQMFDIWPKGTTAYEISGEIN